MNGFRNEKEMWKYQKPRLVGKWDRYELITPSGHPDLKGSYGFKISYVENKVGDYHTAEQRRKALRGAQIKYLDWLKDCGHDVFVCFGSEKRRVVTFYPWAPVLLLPVMPHFWRPLLTK